MVISHRGNFVLAPERGPDGDPEECRLRGAESEWAMQWEATIPHTWTEIGQVVQATLAEGGAAEMEIVVASRSRRALQIEHWPEVF